MKISNSYPNYTEYMSKGRAYDIGKWMSAMKDIYVKTHLGASKKQAISDVISGWDQLEQDDFLNWMKYYESGDHLKYKRAQHSYYVNDDINYFLPNPKSNIPSPIKTINEQIAKLPEDAANIAIQQQNKPSEEDKRRVVEDQRRKILGRLNSAEKLLSSREGQIFAGPEFERLLSAIYELKKQIQTVNKLSISAQTMVDLIVRQANILQREGHKEACQFMVKFAQNTPGNFDFNFGVVPAGGSIPQGGGSLGNNTPDITAPVPEKLDIKDDGALGKFVDNLESSGLTSLKEEDKMQANDEIVIDDDVLLDEEVIPEDNEIVVSAQAVPVAPVPKAPVEVKPAEGKDNLELEAPGVAETGITSQEVKRGPEISQVKSDFDALIDSVFSNLTISDVIKKLEDINKIFRNREIGRQLALVDVMLDRLGLAPYFPTLAEATNKQLEANQYCLTRIEDILSKLRGTLTTGEIDLMNKHQPKLGPEAEKAKQSLQQEEDKEKQRKEVRKKIQDETALEKAVKPEGQVEGVQQELAAQPVEVESPAPVPAPKPAV